jgi:hypothetical protein
MESPKVKTSARHPFAVRKVSWDALWHVLYYARNEDGKLYSTWNRVSQAQAIRISRKLESQYIIERRLMANKE